MHEYTATCEVGPPPPSPPFSLGLLTPSSPVRPSSTSITTTDEVPHEQHADGQSTVQNSPDLSETCGGGLPTHRRGSRHRGEPTPVILPHTLMSSSSCWWLPPPLRPLTNTCRTLRMYLVKGESSCRVPSLRSCTLRGRPAENLMLASTRCGRICERPRPPSCGSNCCRRCGLCQCYIYMSECVPSLSATYSTPFHHRDTSTLSPLPETQLAAAQRPSPLPTLRVAHSSTASSTSTT